MVRRQFSVCLFCGSRTGAAPAYLESAHELGAVLAKRGHRLVYGAGDKGLMGAAARAMMAGGGKVTGVIPRHLVDTEVGNADIDEFLVVETMHQRKMLMFERSDAVVALPGGPGTLDELIEVLTWRQLGLHARPVVVANIDGYWNPLVALIDHMIAHGFTGETFSGFFSVADDAVAAVDRLEAMLAEPAP